MADQLQLRGGTTTEHATFTGASKEVTVDTDKDTLVVHDGVVAGGFPLAKESGSVLSPSSLSLASGTANGVTYLNGSKVLTSGTGLAYNSDGILFVNSSVVASSTTTGLQLRFNGTVAGISASQSGVANYPIFLGGDGFNNGLYIDASSNVGVNTSSPATFATFAVRKGLTIGGVSTSASFSDAANSTFDVRHPSSGIVDLSAQSGSLSFTTGSSEKMRLTSTGLGIGTSSPSVKLDVLSTGSPAQFSSSNASNTLIQHTNTNASKDLIYRFRQNAGSGNWYDLTMEGATNNFTIDYNDTTRLTLDSSGNLGLGVTPSAWALPAVESQYGLWAGRVEGNVTSNAYFNGGYKYIASGIESTRYRQLTGTHAWYNAPSGTAGNPITFTQAMTLDANGNLGIGTSSPSTTLSVAGTAPVITIAPSSGTASSTITLSNPSQSWQLENQYVGGASVGMFRLRDATAGTDVLTVNPSSTAVTLHRNTAVTGTLSITDNLVIGTAGKGIDFSADGQAAGMTSELLDDYEEGTWTPDTSYATFVGAPSSEGTYTKIGRTVVVRGSVTGGTSVAVGATGILVGGLPFTPASDSIGIMAASTTTESGGIRATGPFLVATNNMTPTPSITFTATYFV